MLLNQFPSKGTFLELAETCNVIPVCREILADTETPVSLLMKFHEKDVPGFLLESVTGGEQWARYSFLGIRAHCHIRIFRQTVEITTGEEVKAIAHDNDPLDKIRQIMKAYVPAHIRKLPRFWGGLTGYITYEMVSFFEDIPVSLPDDVPYAHFMIPDRMIIFDNIKQTLTAVSLCFTKGQPDTDLLYERAIAGLDHMTAVIQAPPCPPRPEPKAPDHGHLEAEISSARYIAGVQAIKDHITAGDIFQAVFSQPFSCATTIDPVTVYRAQRHINPSPYMFFMNFKDLVIAGSSPETMIRLENRTATLRPIAGTRPRGITEQADRLMADALLEDEKERAEHVMLIDLGRNDLGRVACAGTVQVTDTMVIERYSHVMHLVSNIVCDLEEGRDAFDLLKATFPAGTLSGAPKIRAMEIISSLEKRPRRIYGGAAGYISFTGNMDLAITIRTAVMEHDRLTVQAGAGIVYDSDPEKELEECISKAKSVETALLMAISNCNGELPCV